MQIKINLKIFFFIIIFYITRQIEIYGVLMLFAFLHELGHLIAGICLGFKPKTLGINPVGLSISFCIKENDYNKKIIKGNILALKKMVIAVMGPMVNIFIVIFAILFNVEFLNISNDVIVYSNILIAFFNLLPIYPLYGGRVLKNMLHIIDGLKNTYMYINIVANVSIIILTIFASIMIFYLKNISVIIIISYLWYLVIKENEKYYMKMRMYKIIESQNS